MQLPLLARYKDIVRYDRAQGIATAVDWRRYPGQREYAAYQTAEAGAQAIAEGAVGNGASAAYLAGYALALAARAWSGRPSEPRRAAIIQAGEMLRLARPFDHQIGRVVDEGLVRADAAILAGGNAEAVLVDYTASQIARADRVAERCGRLAAGLLDQGDHILTHGFAGPALIWLLALAHAEEQKQIQLTVTAPPDDPDQARLAVALAHEIGVLATLRDDTAPEQVFVDTAYQVMFIGAERVAMDGAVAGPGGCAAYVALARRRGVPCYVLGYDGPDPACLTTEYLAADLAAGEPGHGAVVPPEQISALITSRGIYRPEMVRRFLGDGDAPLDVIPLS